MDKVVDCFDVFHTNTKQMSERYANSSEIIPKVKELKYFASDMVTKSALTGLGTTLDSLEVSMKQRFAIY